MKVRGERQCRECGVRWSYYETGSIECPDCGSLRSVGVDDRTAHTDAPATLDLSAHRARFGDARGTLPDEGVDDLKDDLREYARKRGFIRGGELLPLDDTYLAARELLRRSICTTGCATTPTATGSTSSLLAGADDGDRPPRPRRSPTPLREARGMAAVRAVDEYRTDLLAFLDELAGVDTVEAVGESETASVSVAGDDLLARIDPARRSSNAFAIGQNASKRSRVTSPPDADALVDAANALGEYVRTGDKTALNRARDRLSDTSDTETNHH